MIVAVTCMIVFPLAIWARKAVRSRPLDLRERNRISRLSEKLQREALLPFE